MNPLDVQFETAKAIFASLGKITTRKMFGGGGIYCDGLIFAICDGSKFYMKGDSENLSDFESAGLGPFYYSSGSGEMIAMKYYEMPENAVYDPAVATKWGKLGIEAQSRAQLNSAKKKPRIPKI